MNQAQRPDDELANLPLPRPEDKRRALPMSADEMKQRGWGEVDVVFVTGDAYVDHPSFAMAILGRVLEAAGPRRRGPRVRPPRGGPRRPLVNLTTQNSRPSSVVGPAAPLAARARKSDRSNRAFRYYGADRQVCSQYQERLSRIATVKHPKLIQIFLLTNLRRIPPARWRALSGPKASPCSH